MNLFCAFSTAEYISFEINKRIKYKRDTWTLSKK